MADWDAVLARFETGKPLPRSAEARICPPRTYAGRPLIITHNGATDGAAHYNSTAPLLPVVSPPVSPVGAVSPVPSSASDAAVSAAPAIISRHTSQCDAASPRAALGDAATGAAHPPSPRSSALTISSKSAGSSHTAHRRSPRLCHAGATLPATTAVAAVAAALTIEAALAQVPLEPRPAQAPVQAAAPTTAQQTPVVLSQPDVLLPRMPHNTWVAIRDGGVAAAKEAL